jgi:hypothetical protein
MRELRFGSYSIAATLAGTPNLSRLKSIDAVRPLVPAAAKADGDGPGVVAAARFSKGPHAATFPAWFLSIAEIFDRDKPAGGRVSFERFHRHGLIPAAPRI